MKGMFLAAGLSLLATGAVAQAVDCSAFQRSEDGTWTVVRATRLAGVRGGVSKSVGLAPGERFAPDGKTMMGGVDVFGQVETRCR